MKNYDLITPEGTRDLIFDECERLRLTEAKLRGIFEKDGFREIITPGLEFFDVFNSKSRGFPGEELYKTPDDKGRVLVLRPDSTLPIARIAATRLKNAERPLKLFYSQKVFRNNPGKRRRNDEIRQMGVELIGEADGVTDSRIIALATEVLSLPRAAKKRVMLEIGDIGIVSSLLSQIQTDEETKEKIRGLIESKNLPELSELLHTINCPEKGDILALPMLFGNAEKLRKDCGVIKSGETRAKIENLIAFCEKTAAAYDIDILIEPAFAGKITYYSGIVIRGYIEGCGEPVLSGGRYDNLLREFGGSGTATGFMVNVDLFGAAIESSAKEQGGTTIESESENENSARPVRIALTKGRLEKAVVKLLEESGFDVSELKDKGRKLIFKAVSPAGVTYEFILAKSPDVIT
jgi:ATP phosphoribosyltransferase regulatory subunit